MPALSKEPLSLEVRPGGSGCTWPAHTRPQCPRASGYPCYVGNEAPTSPHFLIVCPYAQHNLLLSQLDRARISGLQISP